MAQSEQSRSLATRLRGKPLEALERFKDDHKVSDSGAVRVAIKGGLCRAGYLDPTDIEDGQHDGQPVAEIAEENRIELQQLNQQVNDLEERVSNELEVDDSPTVLETWFSEGARYTSTAAIALLFLHIATPLDMSRYAGMMLGLGVCLWLLARREPMLSEMIGVSPDE